MTDPTPLLVLTCVSATMVIAGLLGIAPRREAPSTPRRPGPQLAEPVRTAPPLGWAWLSKLPVRWRSRNGGDVGDLRSNAVSLLHQHAALLQSGRSQAQAWTDLSAHWRSREDSHPLAQICERTASAEQAGLGAVVGLRRSLASFSAQDRPRAGPFSRNIPATRVETVADPAAVVPPVSRALPGATIVLIEVLQRLISIHALSQSTGAPLSRLCRKAADSLEDSAALDAAVRTAAAGPRMTQLILAALPLGGVAMGALMGAQPLAVLFGSTLGWGCLVAGLGCLLLGWRWSTRLIRAVERHG
ncbi:hypothetical protein [Nesterenkonia sp. CF4.4]|uniref:type II secretion system F family protein n=1 Tax=Nesterenkonia sp. CF4.4 TaxID=3373079 RepID=UPI003EE447CD